MPEGVRQDSSELVEDAGRGITEGIAPQHTERNGGNPLPGAHDRCATDQQNVASRQVHGVIRASG